MGELDIKEEDTRFAKEISGKSIDDSLKTETTTAPSTTSTDEEMDEKEGNPEEKEEKVEEQQQEEKQRKEEQENLEQIEATIDEAMRARQEDDAVTKEDINVREVNVEKEEEKQEMKKEESNNITTQTKFKKETISIENLEQIEAT